MQRKMAAGNWKMNGVHADLAEVAALADLATPAGPELLICPPATLIAPMATMAGPVMIGAQDCHAAPSGAHTGDLSAGQLRDAGASWVIVGHSERRQDHGEHNADVRAKADAGLAAGLKVILCLGETRSEREAGRTLDVVAAQLDGSLPAAATPGTLVVAYEPVWAIGSGLIPTEAEIAAAHGFLHERLARHLGRAADAVRVLYGGSVKAANAAAIFAIPGVDGALVGGASLRAQDFRPIIMALAAA